MELGIILIVFIVLAVVSVVLFGTVVSKDLQMLQQNSYRNERYIHWITTSGDTLSPRRLLNAALFILMISMFSQSIFVIGIVLITMIAECIVLLTRKSKKPLVFTKRVWRLFLTVNIMTWIVAVVVASFINNTSCFEIHTFAIVMMLAIIFYSLRASLTLPVFVLEKDVKPLDVIKRSFELTKNTLLLVFGVQFLYGLVLSAFNIALPLVTYPVKLLCLSNPALLMCYNIIITFACLIFIPFYSSISYMLYKRLY